METTPSIQRIREKTKWQIALRRYILEKNPCPAYAPYFGLDIENFRNWIELQFTLSNNWDNFSKTWQFGHVIPPIHFDLSKESELRLCWNFINIRVDQTPLKGVKTDVLRAKMYFEELYRKTGHGLCLGLLSKINKIELAELPNIQKQESFLISKKGFLNAISGYSSYEFQLLNNGAEDVDTIMKELSILKNLSS